MALPLVCLVHSSCVHSCKLSKLRVQAVLVGERLSGEGLVQAIDHDVGISILEVRWQSLPIA